VWFNFGGNIKSYELDENGTATRFNEANNDYAHTARKGTTEIKANSLGLNFDWQVSDSVHLELDVHDSENKIDNGADNGSGSSPFFILGPNNLLSKTYDYSTGDIPQIELFWPDNAAEASANDFDPLFGEFLRGRGKSEVQQLQFDATWENLNDSALVSIATGYAYTKQTLSGQFASGGTQNAGGYGGNQAIFPDSMFTRQSTGDFLDELSGGGSDLITNYYYSYDIDEAISRAAAYFDGFDTDPLNAGWDTDTEVEEETQSIYVQSAFEFEISDFFINLNMGLRYEETDVISPTQQQVEKAIIWNSPTEWNLLFEDDGSSVLTTTGDYSLLLPSLDFSIELTEDLVGRFSTGKSITRAKLGNLVGARSLSSKPKPGARTGSTGNTDLKPFESTNIDFSLEYYYAEGSYASVGWFQKKVKNFIVQSSETITVDGVRDPFIGPRAQQAIADLGGTSINDVEITELFNQIIANGGGNADGEILQANDDPLTDWLVNRPANGNTKKVDGIELAIQHLFADSGYGFAFNTTIVNGDVEFDTQLLELQEPLEGLSDSANLQAFYDKDGLSVKVTYAWRDSYLLGIGQAQGSADVPPQFFKEFGQWDISANYDIDDNFTVFFEGINLTNETEEIYGRFEEQFVSARQYGTRYSLGARYTF
jgi:TonB-dependent receptor